MYFFSIIIVFLSLLYRKFHNRIPILMYHRIADIPNDRNALSPKKFEEQLQYLGSHHYQTISMQNLYDYYCTNKPFPQKPVLLTFDNAYSDNFHIALTLLKQFNMAATVFPISNWIGKHNKWENFNKALTTPMNYNELKLLKNSGLEIGVHTVNHPFLSQLDEKEVEMELKKSKNGLEENLQIPLNFLCYPYGNFNNTTIKMANKSGYRADLAIFDQAPLWRLDLFALPRIPIPSRQPLGKFKLKISRIHIIFIALRKLELWLKHILRKQRLLFTIFVH